MRIACLLGSPRENGNSSTVAKRFCEEARNCKADVITFSLSKLRYRGCIACMACKTGSDDCVLQDDLAAVLDAVRKADVLVMATPVYYGDVSSQLKGFIDRTFCYLTPEFHNSDKKSRLAPGKRMLFIQSQGHPDEKLFSDIYPRYEHFFSWYGYESNRLIRVCDTHEPGDASTRPGLMRLAEQTARDFVQGK